MGLFEMNAAAEVVHGVAHPDANIIFGTVIDDELGDEIRVTVIAAGFDRWEAGEQKRAALRSVDAQPRPVVRDALAGKDPLDTSGDDDFDVPSFLK
jgi:cell division protein FtsZ